MSKSKNVFISHHSADDDNIKKLKQLLKSKNYQIRNSSIDSTRPNNANNEEYIKSILRSRINWAGTCVVLISRTTHGRDWVDWEIRQAAKQGKRIIGVYCKGESDSLIPESLRQFGDAIVGWQGDRVIGAIDGTINNFENSDCTPMAPMFNTSRVTC